MKELLKSYFSKVKLEFGFNDKKTLSLMLRCFGIVGLQILSFLVKELVFVELVYVIFLIIWDKSKQNKLAYIFFLLPFYNVFRYGTGNVQFYNILDSFKNIYFSVWVLLVFDVVLFGSWCVCLYKKEKKIDIKNYVVWLGLLIILLLPFSKDENISFSNGLVVVSLFATLFLLTQFKEEFDLAKLLKIWFLGLIASVFVFFLKFLLPKLNDYLVVFGTRFSCLLRDPNYLSFEILVLLCGFTALFIKKQCQNIFPIVLLVLSVIGLLTLSKSFVIAFAVYALILFVYAIRFAKHNKELVTKYKKSIIITTVIVGIIGCLVLAVFGVHFVKRLFGIGNKSMADASLMDKITTRRWGIWVKYVKNIFSSFTAVVLGRNVLYGYQFEAIHCTPLQLFYFGGILSVAILVFGTVKFILNNKNNINWFAVLPFVTILVMSCSLDMLFSFRTVFVLFILILSMQKGGNDEKIVFDCSDL